MHVFHVDDGEARSGGERGPKAPHNDLWVHPVDARPRGDETVGRRKRSVLRASEDPANARLLAREPPSLSEHRLGGIDRIHAAGEGNESAGDCTASAPSVEYGPRRDEEALEDGKDL